MKWLRKLPPDERRDWINALSQIGLLVIILVGALLMALTQP